MSMRRAVFKTYKILCNNEYNDVINIFSCLFSYSRYVYFMRLWQLHLFGFKQERRRFKYTISFGFLPNFISSVFSSEATL